MANWSFVGRVHRAIYRFSDGRFGSKLAGLDMLLLTVTGRKSGEPRTVPLACFPDGEDRVVVASNNGQDSDPVWWLNLVAHPHARVTLGRDSWSVVAVLADPEQRARLWPQLQALNPAYVRYEKKTQREIPVVILRRSVDESTSRDRSGDSGDSGD
jgi:deazaflavin-dependent oxidoreductase (nitroreductase family)